MACVINERLERLARAVFFDPASKTSHAKDAFKLWRPRMKKLLTLILAGALYVGSAQAAHVNVLAGLTRANPDTGIPSSSSTAVSFGATLDFAILPFFDVETGLMSVGVKYGYGSTDVKTRAMEIPLLLRFTAIPLVDFGAGAYFQKYNGTYSSTTSGVETTGISWAPGTKQNDFGAKVSARLLLPLAPFTHFIVDANYKLGLFNLAQVGTFKTRELGVLVGLGFGF